MGASVAGRFKPSFSHADRTDSEKDKPPEPTPTKQIVVAVRRWRAALERFANELQSESVAVWLRLCDLNEPFQVDREVDIGVRLHTTPEKPGSLELTDTYTDVSTYLGSVGVTCESGWVIRSMGWSLFAHGPHVLFNLIGTGEFSYKL